MEEFLERQELKSRLCRVKHKIMVLSGKGGVGKSTVAANLAVSLALNGRKVGLLDVDIHGPSAPVMLNLRNQRPLQNEDGIIPLTVGDNLKVMSAAFFLENEDQALIWRGPMKMGVIKQFIKDVNWGDLDYLIVDSPPGTGDEPLSVRQLIDDMDGGIIVTTPQDVAASDVKKSVTFCHKINLPVIGVVENMSGFNCPKCGELVNIFGSGGGEKLAKDMEVPFIGRIPIDPEIVKACDTGEPFVYKFAKSDAGKAFEKILEPVLKLEKTIN
jgi:Mrp family chromosome partitioning ATPase